jgi:hypothetical protein
MPAEQRFLPRISSHEAALALHFKHSTRHREEIGRLTELRQCPERL